LTKAREYGIKNSQYNNFVDMTHDSKAFDSFHEFLVAKPVCRSLFKRNTPIETYLVPDHKSPIRQTIRQLQISPHIYAPKEKVVVAGRQTPNILKKRDFDIITNTNVDKSIAFSHNPLVVEKSIKRRAIISDFYEKAGGAKLHKEFEERISRNPLTSYARTSGMCAKDLD
jgi:hypothetical protein